MESSDWEVQPAARHRYTTCTVRLLFSPFPRQSNNVSAISSPPDSFAGHSEQEILCGLLHHRHVLLPRSQHAQHFLLRRDHSDRYQVSHKDVMKCTSSACHERRSRWNTTDGRLQAAAKSWTGLVGNTWLHVSNRSIALINLQSFGWEWSQCLWKSSAFDLRLRIFFIYWKSLIHAVAVLCTKCTLLSLLCILAPPCGRQF